MGSGAGDGEAGLAVAGVVMVSGWYIGVVGLVAWSSDVNELLALFAEILVFYGLLVPCVSPRRLLGEILGVST